MAPLSRGQQRNICRVGQTEAILIGLAERGLSTVELTYLQPSKDPKAYKGVLKGF